MEKIEFSSTYESMHSAIQSWITDHLKINVTAKRGQGDYTLCNYRAKEPLGPCISLIEVVSIGVDGNC